MSIFKSTAPIPIPVISHHTNMPCDYSMHDQERRQQERRYREQQVYYHNKRAQFENRRKEKKRPPRRANATERFVDNGYQVNTKTVLIFDNDNDLYANAHPQCKK